MGTCNNIETLRDPGYGTKLFFLIIVYSFSLPMHFSKNHKFALCCILYIINVILETLPFVDKWSSFGFPRYAETINFYSHFWSTFILNRIPMLYELSNANFSFLSFFFLSFQLANQTYEWMIVNVDRKLVLKWQPMFSEKIRINIKFENKSIAGVEKQFSSG